MKAIQKTNFSIVEISNLTSGKEILPAPPSGYGNRIISISEDVQSGTPWSNTNQFVTADSPNAEFILKDILNTGTRTVGKFEKYGNGGDNLVVTTSLILLSFQNPTGGNKPFDVLVCYEQIKIN